MIPIALIATAISIYAAIHFSEKEDYVHMTAACIIIFCLGITVGISLMSFEPPKQKETEKPYENRGKL
jgi:ABC-type Mn2+/Zn2+ transport system permease subunit